MLKFRQSITRDALIAVVTLVIKNVSKWKFRLDETGIERDDMGREA